MDGAEIDLLTLYSQECYIFIYFAVKKLLLGASFYNFEMKPQSNFFIKTITKYLFKTVTLFLYPTLKPIFTLD
jgi:hypothetical protein